MGRPILGLVMSHPASTFRPIEEICFSRHLQKHAEEGRQVDGHLICDAVLNGRRRRAGPGTAWFLGRKVAVLATLADNGAVRRVLTAYYA